MSKNYQSIMGDINKSLGVFAKENNGVITAFQQLSKAATADGALDAKTKELMALALGVANHCDGCIGFHTQKLIKLGASRDEIMETLGMAVYMGGGPSLMYAAEAITALDELAK